MLKFYTIYYTTYHNGKDAGTRVSYILCDESEVDEWRVKFTWNNLSELYEQIGCHCNFNIWNFKRGRLVSFYNESFRDYVCDVKEWKHKELNIEVKCEWREYSPSIKKILEWPNGEKAMRYLLERGINIVKG